MSSQKKKINLIIEDTCENCPYMEYDSVYGFVCRKTGKVIVGDCKLNKEGWPNFPVWCLLKDVKEDYEEDYEDI